MNSDDTPIVITYETLNPQTGEFENLTNRQWRLLKVGLSKDAVVSDAMIAIFGGPSDCIAYLFRHRKINQWDTPIENAWLVKRYNDWFPKKPSSDKELIGWGKFIEAVYNLDDLLPIICKLGKVSVSLIESKMDKERLTKRLVEINNRDFDIQRSRSRGTGYKAKNT